MFTEDLTAFFNADELAQTASALNVHAQLVEFPVIFDAAYTQVLGDMVGDTAPQAVARTSDVQALGSGQALWIDGTAYSIVSNQADGTGVSTLVLRKA